VSSESILDQELLREIDLTRYQNGEIEKLIDLLASANEKIKKELKKTQGVYTKQRYKELSTFINNVSKELKDNVNTELDTTELIENEINKQTEILKTSGFEIVIPSEKTIKTSVQFIPFADSANYESFLDGLQAGLYNTWDNAIRTGYMLGSTTDEIIRDVMGTVAKNGKIAKTGMMSTLINSIERNTRTYLQSMSSMTRDSLFKKNESLFSGYQYLATLDRRTCLVCANYDGKVFSKMEDVPRTPIHYNCRCVVVPVVKDINIEDTRSSENGYVDANMTFNDWLNTQSVDVQKEVLGKGRFEIFQKTHKIEQFVDNGQVLALKDLK
jgi:SPP1 gp7 family putative phage head morphogenesis protein